MIKIILKKRISHLGMTGDVIQVKPGYARNFLLPFGYAVPLKKGDEAKLKHHQRVLEKKIEEEKNEASELKIQLEKLTLTFVRKTVEGQRKTFGTIGVIEIAQELEKEGYKIEKRFISLKSPLKETGSYTCDLVLSKNIIAQLKIKIEAETIEEEKKVVKKATKKVSSKKKDEA